MRKQNIICAIINDIFQLGAYETVADFVEKYKDNYDITYMDGTYEERKDYLLEYQNYGDVSTNYVMIMRPKQTGARPLTVKIDNVTSPDEKITLDKAVVIGFKEDNLKYTILPGGFMGSELIKYCKKEDAEAFVNPNESYNVNNMFEYLEERGYTKLEDRFPTGRSVKSAEEKICWSYSGGGDRWFADACSEAGLNGKIPFYRYMIDFDPNTDKLASVTLDYFCYATDASFE